MGKFSPKAAEQLAEASTQEAMMEPEQTWVPWSSAQSCSCSPVPRCPYLGLSLAGQWEGPRAAGRIRLKPKGLPLASGSGRECTVAVTCLLEYNVVTWNTSFKML